MDFDAVYRENAEIVYRYLFSLCGNAHLAEEVTAQTFYEAIRSAGKYRGEAALSTWLCAIGKRLLQKEWQRQKKHNALPLEEIDHLPASVGTEEAAMERSGRDELFRRIHALEPRSREVVYLRLSGELPFAVIGEIMGESETWARVTFYRAKQKLMKGADGEC